MQNLPEEQMKIISMAYMNDLMYVITDRKQMYMIDTETRHATLLPSVVGAVSVATDTLGQKIYWSSTNLRVKIFSRFLIV